MGLSNVKKYFSALYLEDCIGYLGIFLLEGKKWGLSSYGLQWPIELLI